MLREESKQLSFYSSLYEKIPETHILKRIEKVYKETGIVNGGQLTITDENSYEKTFVDLNETKITKQFDMYGRTINVKNNGERNNSVARTYSDDYKAQGSVSYSFYNNYEQDLTGDETNLVTNGSFSSDLSGWEVSNSNKVIRTTSYDCVANNETPGSLQMSGTQSGVRYANQIIDIDNGVSGDEYRLDYFVRNTTHSHMVLELLYWNTVIIEARNNVNGDETWETVAWVDANPFNNQWQKYSYAFDIDFEYNEIQITLAYYFQYGTVRFDDISLVNTYKAPVVESSETDTGTGSENTDTSTGASEQIGCGCDGCNTQNCPCTEHSDNCTLPYCNRGYNFENDSNGITFSLTDGEKTMAMEQTVSGNYYGSQKDLNGIYTGYSYNQMNGQLNSMSDGNNVTNFSYDAMSRLNKVSNDVDGLISDNKMETSYSYENDRIKSITHNGFSYNYEYDDWGNPTEVKVGEQELVSYAYDSEDKTRDRLNRITYGNGDYTVYTYNNANGNITSIESYSEDGTLVADYVYGYVDGQVQTVTSVTDNCTVKYTDNGIEYYNSQDDIGIPIYFNGYETDENEKEIPVEILGGLRYTKDRNTVDSNSLEGTTTTISSFVTPSNKEYNLSSVTDYFGRTENKSFSYILSQESGVNHSIKNNVEYTYRDYENVEEPGKIFTTSQVTSYKTSFSEIVGSGDDSTTTETVLGGNQYYYEYDGKGNITRISCADYTSGTPGSATEICSYVYDSVGQLVRENDKIAEVTFVYVYDKGGNLVQRKIYEYTTGELPEEPDDIWNYTYDNTWKDKLTAFAGFQIQTDSMGNPLNYYTFGVNGGITGNLEWNGRQLSAAVVDGVRYEYSYNADGLRTKAIYRDAQTNEVGSIFNYFWNNGKMTGYCVTEEDGTIIAVLKNFFDNSGEQIGYEMYLTDDDTYIRFFFEKNLQGDIIGVYNEEGEKVLTYWYDSWGNISPIYNRETNDIYSQSLIAALYTPITYRGYIYDSLTGLYYLQSRYYNPTYGRFLNADTTEILEATQGTPLGANLFAYCNNNPVNMVDYSGMLGVVGTILLAFFLLIVLYLAADFWYDVYFEWLLDKLFDSVPGLSTVLSLWDAVSFIDDVNDKYWMCFSVFAAHAKNIIDYGKNINLNPTYPGYDDYEYKIMCKNAYELAVGNTSLTANDTWESLGPDGQYTFVHEMAAYDESMYHNLLLLVYRDLIVWGQDKVKDFFKGIVQIFLP